MDSLNNWTFWLTAFAIVATPGTGAIYTVASGLARGWRAGVWAAFASTLGILPHVAAALAGLAALLHTSALLFGAVKWAGVLYLLYMAWGMAREAAVFAPAPDAPRKSAGRVLADGVTLNLLNPKLSIFFVAFLPQFLTPGSAAPLAEMLVLSGAFMALTFAVFAVYGCAAGLLRSKVLSRPKLLARLRQALAGALGLLALQLAASGRN